MYKGATATKFGQYSVAEPVTQQLLFHRGESLREVSHAMPLPVLDQEDLIKQGVNTATLVEGAKVVDALGSCTCNAGTSSLAERLVAAGKNLPDGLSESDAAKDEAYAIMLYHAVTDQTGNPAQEWPPTDCGSTGLFVCTELEHQGLITSHTAPAGVSGALSALQDGTVIEGGPWFNSWMEPDADGFIDGDGSLEALEAAVNSGVAGGHERCQVGIAQLAQSRKGGLELGKTVIEVLNSWSESFGKNGRFYVHASTYNYLNGYMDYKQFIV